MASDDKTLIEELSSELVRKVTATCRFENLVRSTAALDIKEQFEEGRGLRDFTNYDPNRESDGEDDKQQDGSEDEYKPDEYDPSGSDVHSSSSTDDDDDDFDPTAWVLEYLNSPRSKEAINLKYHTVLPEIKVPGLRPGIVPMDHQVVGCWVISKSITSPSKGSIVADPPGLGKTLQTLMAVAMDRRPGDGPSIVVCPASCVAQWSDETAKFFLEGHMKVFVLAGGESISPSELFKYDLVITSYSRLVAELVRARRFVREMKDWTRYDKKPKRPALSLIPGIFGLSSKHVGRTLVLDEAHFLKNIRGRRFKAVKILSGYMGSCVMLTGTPLDNTWRDAYALMSLLKGHPFENPKWMSYAFLPQGVGKKSRNAAPRGRYLIRIAKAMDMICLRRPIETIQHRLTSVTTAVVQFVLPLRELNESNSHFEKYQTWLFMSKAKKGKAPAAGQQHEEGSGFGSLQRATHWANHPMLQDILEFESQALDSNMDHEDAAAAIEFDETAEHKLELWREDIGQDFKWRSPRIDTIVETVNKHRDLRPGDAMIIMDESIFFLDIVAIALSKMAEPIECFRFDGRMHMQERDAVVKKFWAAQGTQILLASRGTGGAGLNLQCANVLIQCCPWWKVSWEEQALGRLHRAGQSKPVFYYKIEATGFGEGDFRFCLVERFKLDKRNEKHATNESIMRRVTRADNVRPPKRVCC